MPAAYQNSASLLTRMVRVLDSRPEDDGPSERGLRRLLEDHPEQFFTQYERVEARVKGQKAAKKGEGKVADVEKEVAGVTISDEAVEKLEEVMDRLEVAWGEKWGNSSS